MKDTWCQKYEHFKKGTLKQNKKKSLLQLPDFDFTDGGNWSTWRQEFQRFRITLKLSEELAGTQVCTLIYWMGTETEQI